MKQKISFVLELTQSCNNDCLYCYNVWKADRLYPRGEVCIEKWKKILKNIASVNPYMIGISGGEPLLNKNLYDILAYIKQLKIPVILITNGTLLTDDIIQRCISQDVQLFELPLLSSNAQLHDMLARHDGAWKKVIDNMKRIKKFQGNLAVAMIITKSNVHEVRAIAELAVALGASSILCNRFNVGGTGVKFKKELMVTPHDLQEVYRVMDEISREYDIPVSAGVPVPPCVFNTMKYEYVQFSQCQVGGMYPYYAIDPLGNVRPCNHSPTIIGNALSNKMSEIIHGEKMAEYVRVKPTKCQGCVFLSHACRGGCMAAGESYYNDLTMQDPFVVDYLNTPKNVLKK